MKKIFLIGFCLCAGGMLSAGFADHDDCTGFPNVNVDAHLLKIARYYYPDTAGVPDAEKFKGLPRSAAWKKDIAEAAAGLNIPQEQLDKFSDYVVNCITNEDEPAIGDHPELLEFKLYSDGYYAFCEVENGCMPPAWEQLLALPVKDRLYTTIPVLYNLARHTQHQVRSREYLVYSAKIAEARKQGCKDTQGCERALIEELPAFVHEFDNLERKVFSYRRLIQEFALNWVAKKPWRYTNEMDYFSWASCRGDRFYSGYEMPALRYSLYQEKPEVLRELCKRDPLLRDFIVGIGLTNSQMWNIRKIAVEFAMQSPLNAPVLALRLPYDEVEQLLAGKEEHARLLAQLKLHLLFGPEKVDAIDAYIAKYPDYTAADMPKTSVALNTHEELQAIAGLIWLKQGVPDKALERWMQGGTPEDIGLIAEQVFTIPELIAFCKKHAPEGAEDEFYIWSCQCVENDKILYPVMIGNAEAKFVIRNILARRLMREKRYADAKEWFTGRETRRIADRFFRLKERSENKSLSADDRLEATLSLAALIRSSGDRLFGTYLEPDNLICNGEYPCEWGGSLDHIRLNKPDMPRFHYRWIAAEYYRTAANMTTDAKIRGYCYWLAGTILKNRDIALADKDFKKLYYISPELTDENWFMPLSGVSAELQEWHRRKIHFLNAERFAAWMPELPPVEKVALPSHDGTADALLKLGREIYEKAESFAEIKQSLYALSLAGEKGSSDAYAWCGIVEFNVGDKEQAVAWFKKALKLNPASNLAKHELGRTYLELGFWKEAIALMKGVADSETENKELLGYAAYNMYNFYKNGKYGVEPDEKAAERYLRKSADAGCRQALDIAED